MKNRIAQIDQILAAVVRAMVRLEPPRYKRGECPEAIQLELDDSIAWNQLNDARDELRELRARFACCAENVID